MNIPNYSNENIAKNNGALSDAWSLIFQQLITQLQQNFSDYGFYIPKVTSAPNSAKPPGTGTFRDQVQATFGQPNGVVAGDLIFDPYEQNGAVLPARNGQLFIMLNDGQFHPVTNT